MSLLPEYSGFDNLKILSEINHNITDEDIYQSMELVGLDRDNKQKVKEYSLGMKQKLNIAQAIMEKPKILLLDEPTNALDQETIKMVREVFLKLRDQGSTILIASHNQEDLEILSDEILKMVDGKLIPEK